MARDNELIHNGVVKFIEDRTIKVSVVAVSACASCKAKDICSASETEEKIIEIQNKDNINISVGDKVEIGLSQHLGFKALFWGYLLPFLLVVTTLITSLSYVHNQGIAGALSLAVLIPYYFILFYFRDKFKKTFSFTLRKQSNY